MQSFTDLVKDTRELVSLSARGQQLSLADQRSHSCIFGDYRRYTRCGRFFLQAAISVEHE